MPWDDNLDARTTAYQIASSTSQNIRVIAGPGTGKSFAMKRRVARLLENGVEPRSILPVTFTRVAAGDLHRELVGMQVPGCDQLKGVTLHSLALHMLSRNHVLEATGRTPRPLNDFEIEPMIADLKAAHGGKREVKKLIKAYEAAWARLQHEEPGYIKREKDRVFEMDLRPWLDFHHAMLIGEVIPYLYQYLRDNPSAEEHNEFSHVLVDEYQDLNKAEQGIVDLLGPNSENCVVGDDDQSIYSFKHAHPLGIREWAGAKKNVGDFTLDECRRCPTTVTKMAASLIAYNRNRTSSHTIIPRPQNGPGDVRIIQFKSLRNEVDGVADKIVDMVRNKNVPPGDILVLAPRSVIGTPLFERLDRDNIPVKSYYAEGELDEVAAQEQLALLRLFVDPEDRVALRWLLGFGSDDWKAALYKRLRNLCESEGLSPWKALEQLASGAISIPHKHYLVVRFLDIRAALQSMEALPSMAAVVDQVLPDDDDRVRALRELATQVLRESPDADKGQFLSQLSNAISKPEIPDEVEEVRIMTLHKSKGLSAPVTFVCGCMQGLLPRQPEDDKTVVEQEAEVEEQRRLFYVGITRVKADRKCNKPGTLMLTYSQEMPVADAYRAGIQPASVQYSTAYLLASRFIRELGPAAPRPVKS